jgi:TPP-dependent pyruvate/acetoin dehydrogenase alpha subunit
MMALREDDLVITSYRDHVQAMVKGIPPEEVMAELYGKAGGCVGGKGGSMHMFDAARGFFGGHGIVGGQIGVGTGMAYAQKYKGTDGVTLCFFGEAAVNQGIGNCPSSTFAKIINTEWERRKNARCQFRAWRKKPMLTASLRNLWTEWM